MCIRNMYFAPNFYEYLLYIGADHDRRVYYLKFLLLFHPLYRERYNTYYYARIILYLIHDIEIQLHTVAEI